jgi:outer membrane protein assembly factor BamB
VLVCCQTADGKELWRKSLPQDLGGKKGDDWGYSESVLVDGDHVVCTPGGPTATLAALDKRTGELVWKSAWPEDRGAGHASMAVAEVDGTRLYVQTTDGGAVGVRASDGKLLWSFPIQEVVAVCPSPIVLGTQAFLTFGYRRGGVLLQMQGDGAGGVAAEPVYKLNPDLANKHGGVVVVGEHIYGDSDDRGIPFCAELKTGKEVWRKRASGKGSASFTAADGRLYIHFTNGVMVLAKADPAGYVEVGSFKVPGSGQRPSWAHPVVCGGRLYVREGDTILCYDVTANPSPNR